MLLTIVIISRSMIEFTYANASSFNVHNGIFFSFTRLTVVGI